MQKNILLLCLLCLTSLYTKADTSQWFSDLLQKNIGLIDSIRVYDLHPAAPNHTTYIVYYNQPLQHAKADSPRFHMRALVTVDNRQDPTTAVNHVFCSGYNLPEDYLDSPDSVFAHTLDCVTEIAHRYRANFIQIEHRYFQYSAPDKCWEQLDYCKAEEAAQDFHSLFEALKKVLKGKWVMSGVSKGGITTLLQHTFFPDDMDIFLPYAAPFFDSDRSRDVQTYWRENGWSKEFRDTFKAISQHGLGHIDTIFPIFLKMNGGESISQAHIDSIYGNYIASVSDFGFLDHCYSDTTKLRRQMSVNDSIMKLKGLEYGDTVYAHMFGREVFALDSLPKWIDTLRAYPDRKTIASRAFVRQRQYRPFGVTSKEWWDNNNTTGAAYEYQSKCELGYFDACFEMLVDDPEIAENWNKFWREKYSCMRDVTAPCFNKLSYSRSLYDRVMAATKNATKPIVLIYGLDDGWTGGAVKDEFINGINVRKFILPAQNHMVSFTSNTDPTLCSQIVRCLDDVLGSPVNGIVISTVDDESEVISRKVMQNGKIYILRNNRKFTTTGAAVE